MEFSSLVLMEKDSQTGFMTKELGSFEVNEGALYVVKLFALDGIVNLYFDTNKDVEEWEYSAIYDLFNTQVFIDEGFEIETYEEEYNPTFILKFKYSEEHQQMKEKLDKAVALIDQEMINVLDAINGKEEEYK